MKQLEAMKATKIRPKPNSQKPNIGAEHLKRPNRPLKSEHKLEMARRRARVAELARQGKSVRTAEEILRSEGFKHCDHVTVAADLKLECDRLAADARATTVQYRQEVLEKLRQAEAFIQARGWDDPDYMKDLMAIVDRLIRLLGLSQERHQINVAVTNDGIPPEKLIGWRRWLRETQFISEEDYDAVWAVCRKLSKPPTAESTALCVPPADSPLWHDEDDEKGEAN
jgi:hypothetical protein